MHITCSVMLYLISDVGGLKYREVQAWTPVLSLTAALFSVSRRPADATCSRASLSSAGLAPRGRVRRVSQPCCCHTAASARPGGAPQQLLAFQLVPTQHAQWLPHSTHSLSASFFVPAGHWGEAGCSAGTICLSGAAPPAEILL